MVHRPEPSSDELVAPSPVRTCVGCRVRAAKTALVRFVLVEGRVVPDPDGRLPGRGASLHPDQECLDLAERRRAFGRALRHAGPVDLTAVREFLGGRAGTHQPSDGGRAPARPDRKRVEKR